MSVITKFTLHQARHKQIQRLYYIINLQIDYWNFRLQNSGVTPWIACVASHASEMLHCMMVAIWLSNWASFHAGATSCDNLKPSDLNQQWDITEMNGCLLYFYGMFVNSSKPLWATVTRIHKELHWGQRFKSGFKFWAFSTTQSDIGWGIQQFSTTSIVQESAKKTI